ncbi:MAG: hypothetical protein FWF24_03165 [Alphaproteobacteria bacterium]|nr:hypothetical protein [Alphaproteobacteria bacterium]
MSDFRFNMEEVVSKRTALKKAVFKQIETSGMPLARQAFVVKTLRQAEKVLKGKPSKVSLGDLAECACFTSKGLEDMRCFALDNMIELLERKPEQVKDSITRNLVMRVSRIAAHDPEEKVRGKADEVIDILEVPKFGVVNLDLKNVSDAIKAYTVPTRKQEEKPQVQASTTLTLG